MVRLAQFLFALLVIVGAFGAGVMFGWAKWGLNSRSTPQQSGVDHSQQDRFKWDGDAGHREADPRPGQVASANLFAPDSGSVRAVVVEVDLEVERAIDLRSPARSSGPDPLAGPDSVPLAIGFVNETSPGNG